MTETASPPAASLDGRIVRALARGIVTDLCAQVEHTPEPSPLVACYRDVVTDSAGRRHAVEVVVLVASTTHA